MRTTVYNFLLHTQEYVLQFALDFSNEQKASLTILVREHSISTWMSLVNTSNSSLLNYVVDPDELEELRNRTCTEMCFALENYMQLVSAEISSNLKLKALAEPHEFRARAAVLHFGCTARENSNNADVRLIATDMQPFDCKNMPPGGDGPRAFQISLLYSFLSQQFTPRPDGARSTNKHMIFI